MRCDEDARLLVVLGPTASGKTSLAVGLARALGGEILSADSRQVYRGMDIGTGKDLSEYTSGGEPVPYHLIDIVPAGTEYNLYRYQKDFDAACADVLSRGHTPVLCGGSGLYLCAALGKKNFREVPCNTDLRKELETKTDSELEQILRSFGPLHNHTDTETRERCLRAIEILQFEQLHPAPERHLPPALLIGIAFDPDILRRRIRARLESRLEEGMIDEVKTLLQSGVTPSQLMYYGLEYKFLTQYITGELSYADMKENLYHAICQFAKRQRTWFRKMEKDGYEIHWIDGHLPVSEQIKKVLEMW